MGVAVRRMRPIFEALASGVSGGGLDVDNAAYDELRAILAEYSRARASGIYAVGDGVCHLRDAVLGTIHDASTLDYADTGHQTLGRDPCCASRRNARLRAHASRAALGQNGRRGAADGAECVISGIRPQIAQTIVDLGIDFGGHADQSESGGSPPARVCLHVRKLGASS